MGFDLWIISSNGAVTRSTKGESFHRDLMPQATAVKICRHMRDFRNYSVITFDREGMGAIVCENHDQLYGVIQRWMEKNAPYIEYVSPIEKALIEDPIQVMFCGPVEPDADRAGAPCRRRFRRRNHGTAHAVRLSRPDHRRYPERRLLQGPRLERWATHRGMDRLEVMAIGDNYNDVEMLTFAGHPVIMGNASDDLKQNGWTITLHNDESGVAAAIEQVLDANAASVNA